MTKYLNIKPGDIIISSPYSDLGMIFNKTVILIISSNETGITGVIINKILNHIDNETLRKALAQSHLEIHHDFDLSSLSTYFGGPIDQDRGILLHSNDYQASSCLKINESICLTNELKIFADIIDEKGPTQKMMILGYCSWKENQLVDEIMRNDWILLENKPENNNFYQLIFIEEYFSKWNKALNLAGISLTHYSNIEGHA